MSKTLKPQKYKKIQKGNSLVRFFSEVGNKIKTPRATAAALGVSIQIGTDGVSLFLCHLILDDVHLVGDVLLQLAHSNHGEDVGHTGEDDGQTDEGRKRLGGDVKVLLRKKWLVIPIG
jgi:hypothetical protein